jgi:ferredoxin-NADP reductase
MMKSYVVSILETKMLTHDVIQIRTEKPVGYSFEPGQATDLAIYNKAWQQEKRPFTFTGTPDDAYLEFIIKIYAAHHGVTDQLRRVHPGDLLLIGEPWGAIQYNGKGLFIAGGAGITPFISIFRQLAKQHALAGNRLVFANKTSEDIILEAELDRLLGRNVVHILSNEMGGRYKAGFVTAALIRENISDKQDRFYLCGPPPMMTGVLGALVAMGIDEKAVTIEI